MEKTNTEDFHDQIPKGGNRLSDKQNSEEEVMSGSSRDESSHEDLEIEWDDEFSPVEVDPAAVIRPHMDLFPGFEVEELLSLMPVMVESYMESNPNFSRRLPHQRPGELSRFLEYWNKRFPEGNSTSKFNGKK
ncbi:hypothetical protein ACOSQ2_030881 [Xanthoceras sorbifolium]